MTDSSMSTTSSNDLNSHHGIHQVKRLRTIKLSRPHTANLTIGHPLISSFGFSLRGGREFGTGFFISNVMKGSEADVKGLRIGDQIIRVGNNTGSYRVDDAVHKELSQFIASQNRLILKVRGVGILPVKERASDPLTWHVVPAQNSLPFTQVDSQPAARDIRILLNVAPRTKLGCGICAGPEWKPGIFVQFTKDNGIAKEAGMQPGDQIVSCNGIDFSNILFSEAVSIMKATSVLELYIRPAAGLDLFPSESSGYNSSASSVTGDQSPCWGEQTKRLSIVREESTNSSDRMNGGGGGAYGKMRFSRSDKPLHVDVPKVPANYSKNNNNYGELKSNAAAATPNTTIINLTENGTLINNTMLPSLSNNNNNNNGYAVTKDGSSNSVGGDVDPTNKKIADICFVSRQNETKIVTVEVHRSSNTSSTSGNFPSLNGGGEKDERESIASNTSSLSSAISDELKRRAEKKMREQSSAITNSNGPSQQQQQLPQSQQLNQKPTTTPVTTNGGNNNNNNNNIHEILMDEFKKAHRKMFKNGFVENEYQPRVTDDENNNNTMALGNDGSSNIPVAVAVVEERQMELKKNGTPRILSNGVEKKKPAPLPPPKQQLPSSANTKFAEVKEPWTPKPDYDSPDNTLLKSQTEQKGTMSRIALQEMAKAKGDLVEMESIDSFRLNSPSSKIPIPPPMYFQSHKFEPMTLKKAQQKPVSVIVSSYDNKREPGRLDFVDDPNSGDRDRSFDENNVDMSTRLKYELEKTLSRSNLRRSLDNILKPDSQQPSSGNDRSAMPTMKKHEPSTLNGILKNGTSKANSSAKNITFNDMPAK